MSHVNDNHTTHNNTLQLKFIKIIQQQKRLGNKILRNKSESIYTLECDEVELLNQNAKNGSREWQ